MVLICDGEKHSSQKEMKHWIGLLVSSAIDGITLFVSLAHYQIVACDRSRITGFFGDEILVVTSTVESRNRCQNI